MERKKNNFQALQYVRHFLALLAPYFYGCFGQIAGWDLYNQKKEQYPDQYPPKKWTVASFVKDFGKRCFDCIGLVFKGYQFNKNNDFDSDPVYDSKYDYSADGLFDICTEKGPISTMPDIPGILVHKKGHVGMYEGIINGKKTFIECAGHAKGTIRSYNTKWTEWAKCPFWVYIDIDYWLNSLYLDIMARDPEADGLIYWKSQLETKAQTPTDVLRFFLNSPELEQRKLSDKDFVTILYYVFFDREPDEEGKNYWLGQIKTEGREKVVEGFLWSDEWADMEEYLLYIC